jgi:hypothetical protein
MDLLCASITFVGYRRPCQKWFQWVEPPMQ